MNRKLKKAIQDTFVSPEAMRKEEFFKNAENLIDKEKYFKNAKKFIDVENSRRNKGIPLIYRLSTAVLFTAAAIGIGIGLNNVKPSDEKDFRNKDIISEDITGTVQTAGIVTDKNITTTVPALSTSVSGDKGKISAGLTTSSKSNGKSSDLSASNVTTVNKKDSKTTVTTAKQAQKAEIKHMSKEDEAKMRKKVSEILAEYTASIISSSIVVPNIVQEEVSLDGIEKYNYHESYDYIREHELDFDVDENGVFDYLDAYYGFVYFWDFDNNILPADYVERIEENFDIDNDGRVSFNYGDIYEIAGYYCDTYIHGDKSLLFELDNMDFRFAQDTHIQQNYLEFLYSWDNSNISQEYRDASYEQAQQALSTDKFNFDIDKNGKVEAYDIYKLAGYWYCVYSNSAIECAENNGYVEKVSSDDMFEMGISTYLDRCDRYYDEVQICFRNNDEFRELTGMSAGEWDRCGKFFDKLLGYEYFNIIDKENVSDESLYFIIRNFYNFYPTNDEMTEKSYYDRFNPTFCLDEDSRSYLVISHDFNEGFASEMYNTFESVRKEHIYDPYEGKTTKLDGILPLNFADEYDRLFTKMRADVESGKAAPPDVNFDGKCNGIDYLLMEMYTIAVAYHRTAENCMFPAEIWNYIDTQLDYNNDGVSGDWYDIMLVESMAIVCGGRWTTKIDFDLEQYYDKLAGRSDSMTIDSLMSDIVS